MINKMCLTKNTYNSKKEAESDIKFINDWRLHEGFEREYFKVYKCPVCGKFHLSRVK